MAPERKWWKAALFSYSSLYHGDTPADFSIAVRLDDGQARGKNMGRIAELELDDDAVRDLAEAIVAHLMQKRASSRLLGLQVQLEKTVDEPKALTEQQRRILWHICRGATNEEIAADLGMKYEGVKNRLVTLMRRMGARNRSHLVRRAYELGYLDLSNDTSGEESWPTVRQIPRGKDIASNDALEV